MNIIEIKNLTKCYGDIVAVDNISFEVEKGSLFAFLGVNGAGKSTTINILSTLLKKDGGKVVINGHDLDKDANLIKNDIGIVFQNGVLDNFLTVKENLTIRGSYYGLMGKVWKKRFSEIVNKLDLQEILNRPYGKISGGQKRRVDIARGIINNPKILFLDEPTTGLDPQTRQKIWQVIGDLMKDGTTIFLTTHYMEEADSANKIVIINNGKIVATGSPSQLKNEYSGEYIKIYQQKNQEMDEMLVDLDFRYEQNYYKIKMKNTDDIKQFILNNQKILNDFEVVKGNMDDVFLNATGRSLKEANYEINTK